MLRCIWSRLCQGSAVKLCTAGLGDRQLPGCSQQWPPYPGMCAPGGRPLCRRLGRLEGAASAPPQQQLTALLPCRSSSSALHIPNVGSALSVVSGRLVKLQTRGASCGYAGDMIGVNEGEVSSAAAVAESITFLQCEPLQHCNCKHAVHWTMAFQHLLSSCCWNSGGFHMT